MKKILEGHKEGSVGDQKFLVTFDYQKRSALLSEQRGKGKKERKMFENKTLSTNEILKQSKKTTVVYYAAICDIKRKYLLFLMLMRRKMQELLENLLII